MSPLSVCRTGQAAAPVTSRASKPVAVACTQALSAACAAIGRNKEQQGQRELFHGARAYRGRRG